MRGMVFAAGLGTRLRPLTTRLPKPAVPVANRPLCWFSLSHLARSGVSHVVVNTHHLADAVVEAIDGSPVAGLSTLVVREEALLGTGGGLRHGVLAQSAALGRSLAPDEPFFLMNGDILFAPDLAAALALHRRLDAFATMVLRPDPDAARYGAIDIDRSGRVRRMLGEPREVSEPVSAVMFTGVHVLSARAIAALPEAGCIIQRGYRRWLEAGEVIAGFVDHAPWRDLGTIPEYLAANVALASGALRWPGIAVGEAGIVDARASLGEGALLRACVIGERASVAPGARLERCVVWPGVLVHGDSSDAVMFE